MAGGTKAEDKDIKSDSVSKTAEPWEASSHTLYLHHLDQPGAVLVAQPLMEDNFSEWMQSMSDALKIKNKIGFVLGTQIKPTLNEEEKLQWERCDTLVKTWLVASMLKHISKSVKNCKTSRAVWLDLQERLLQTNTILWDDRDMLCNVTPCGCGLDEFIKNQKTMKFLMGLNDNFSILRGTIVAIDPLPTVNKAYFMALRHEKQLEVAGGGKAATPQEGVVFAVKETTQEDEPEKQEHRYCKCGKKHLTSKYR
ncbi:hypothetical protein ACLB2K_011844 [Fragaria x ananassa]